MLDTTNYPNLERWLTALETTDLLQVQATLCAWSDSEDPDSPLGYCCLGIGVREMDLDSPDLQPWAQNLPGHDWLDWLGLDIPAEGTVNIEHEAMRGVQLDWPMDLYPWRCDVEHETHDESEWMEPELRQVTGDSLNDSCRLTFPQIAQMYRYMGLADLPVSAGGGRAE